MKLSKAQQGIMDEAKERIDFARSATLYNWIRKRYLLETASDDKISAIIERDKKIFGYDFIANSYEEEKNGITVVMCNSRTLYKLRDYGLIEIIKDSNGRTYACDVIKVLNY